MDKPMLPDWQLPKGIDRKLAHEIMWHAKASLDRGEDVFICFAIDGAATKLCRRSKPAQVFKRMKIRRTAVRLSKSIHDALGVHDTYGAWLGANATDVQFLQLKDWFVSGRIRWVELMLKQMEAKNG